MRKVTGRIILGAGIVLLVVGLPDFVIMQVCGYYGTDKPNFYILGRIVGCLLYLSSGGLICAGIKKSKIVAIVTVVLFVTLFILKFMISSLQYVPH